MNFFGGEPLLRFDLIKDIYNYVQIHYPAYDISFFVSTNGTLLTDEMKAWFSERKDKFCLGLSLDGDKDTQNYNRSKSFEKIDITYFAETWPQQYFKLTMSEYSVKNYAHDVKYIHSFGVCINGGDVWALIPFILGFIALVASIVNATNNFRHMITWRVMLWTSIQAILILGIGIMARELMSSWQLSEAMGLYDLSYAANLIYIVIIGSVIVGSLFAADEYFKPELYLPMSPSDIEEWKEKHPEELSNTSIDENSETNSDSVVKDE